MDKIRPGDFAGFHAIGRATGTADDLSGTLFRTHCPLDIPPRDLILALLGVTDREDAAHPREDGWFISDFYLFHFLLVPTFLRSHNQLWMTCEDPKHLVENYTEYVHGDSTGERRVVLDQKMLPSIQDAVNIRVFSREDLAATFLGTLSEQVKLAEDANEHLLILIFGHGTESHGVEVGDSIMQMNALRRLLNGRSAVTLFTTACYSGGWVVEPDAGGKQLNATAIAAAGPGDESSSWPASGSVGRAGGGLLASAIRRDLIDTNDLIQQAMDHPTYIQLAKTVHTLVMELGLLGSKQAIHFAAKDDEWEISHRTRLGLPLLPYKERWESLRSVPKCAVEPVNQGMSGAGCRATKRLRKGLLCLFSWDR